MERADISLSVDAVIFGYQTGKLSVLLVKRKNDPYKDCWAIPGGFVDQDEPLEDAAKRELHEETSVVIDSLEQLHAFGAPERDPRGRVVSIAYFGMVRPDKVQIKAADDAKEVAWFEIDQLPKLAFDHELILDMAVKHLQDKTA